MVIIEMDYKVVVDIINHPKTDGIDIVRIFYSLVQTSERGLK